MKPAAFDYHAPRTVDEALGLLADYGGDAKLLAGGQSLVPTMNFRLAQPAVLVDLNGIDELFFLREHDSGLRCGAMTRQSSVERSPLAQRIAPLLYEAMPHIAHAQIRNRGTIGGSLAHADPAAELPAAGPGAGCPHVCARCYRRALDHGARLLCRAVRHRNGAGGDADRSGLSRPPSSLAAGRSMKWPASTATTHCAAQRLSSR